MGKTQMIHKLVFKQSEFDKWKKTECKKTTKKNKRKSLVWWLECFDYSVNDLVIHFKWFNWSYQCVLDEYTLFAGRVLLAECSSNSIQSKGV